MGLAVRNMFNNIMLQEQKKKKLLKFFYLAQLFKKKNPELEKTYRNCNNNKFNSCYILFYLRIIFVLFCKNLSNTFVTTMGNKQEKKQLGMQWLYFDLNNFLPIFLETHPMVLLLVLNF